ncbi:mrna cleavage factor complex component pcf11 [Stemphylium lycopersici]|uniref:Mrna cleavage factor complex component pcf11 n=1 Tax=Stemphylium lycopersici TaxID=183478 RepID=A0A364N0L7_STELY|nr:mrna cleavage factor complex component pcf11 [Stemphylium lycopersici]RAR08890.1 mrna cleavage factor complex component pcf11 [Stemphylium lycopersici]
MSLPAAEVAADFRDALQDLRMNSRPEISNLTLIAKENTEYAEAISNELQKHIQSTRPEWKLPALYVLDSIVKNVGTPYTVYIGRNLYRTFMDAYLVMDQGTRKNMEGLLRTWKMPVPESMDPRPVFQADVTQDIENALAKFRAAQQQVRPQHALPPRPPSLNVAWRGTSTPPQNGPRYAAPNDPRARPSYPPTPQYAPQPHAPTPPMTYQPPQPPASPMSSVDLADLKAEITQLISTTQNSFAHNPADAALRTKLSALLSLKQILDTQTLPPQQLEAVRQQIRALAPPPAPTPIFAPSTPVYPQQHTMPPGYPPQLTPVTASPGSAPPNVAQLLAGFRPPPQSTPQPASTPNPPALNLAELLKRVSSPAQSNSVSAPAPFQGFPPPISTPVPASQPPPSQSGTPTANLAALLAQFSKPGAAPPSMQPTPVQNNTVPQLQPQSAAHAPALGSAEWLLKALSSVPGGAPLNAAPTPQPTAQSTTAPVGIMDHIELTTASMKQPRLHLVSRLYEAKPNICATCGRRFESTPEGKEKKARHMDWHFKVKDPDAAKRGVHRSWYIPEKEWIEYREVDETAPNQTNDPSSATGGSKPKKQTKDRYVSVPQDVTLQQAPCPICQEKFETQWNVEANDFVWMDALSVGGKVYHATCFEEYSKGVGIEMPGTPDSVLGKRKADLGTNGEGKKVKAY